MDEQRLAAQRAYEGAAARYRALYERYFPRDVLGGRPALPMTPEAQLELDRLEATRDSALAAFNAAKRR